MTYNVFSGTLNPTQSINRGYRLYVDIPNHWPNICFKYARKTLINWLSNNGQLHFIMTRFNQYYTMTCFISK